MATVREKALSVKQAGRILANVSTAKKNALLKAIASELKKETRTICDANAADLRLAKESGISDVLFDRLTLNEKRIAQMIAGVRDIMKLPDPVGEISGKLRRPNGLTIEKMRVPLGSIGIIYEARPNVTVDASVLCLKAGNTVLLRGGSEAIRTNTALVKIIKTALKKLHLPDGCVELIETTDRSAVAEMIKQDASLDVIIPRGSQSLIRFIAENSVIPVIVHGEGNCHVFVDSSADLAAAQRIVVNAKVQRPSVCNAAEKLAHHRRSAPQQSRRTSR
jgi:glutamate-5-semialdehyde dehydrogenase